MKLPEGMRALQRTFEISNYRLFVIGNLSSNLGLWVQRIAIGWLTWELTNSTAWLGGMAMAESAPTIIFGLIAGTVVDRVDYFKMLRFTQACQLMYSVTMAALTFTGLMNIWVLMTLTIIRGSIVAFNRPTRMTVVYNMVGRELLPSVLALNSTIFNTSRFLGPAIGGVILAAGGPKWTFVVGAMMFFVFTMCLRSMNMPQAAAAASAPHRRSMLGETIEGLRYTVSHAGIRKQLTLLIGTSLFAKPVTDLLPGFAAQVFNMGPHGLAILLSAHGIGATTAGVWLASRDTGIKGMTRVTIRNVLFMSIGLLIFTATDYFWIAAPIVCWIGFTFITQGVTNQTLIQSAVDPALRGRVVSTYGLIAQGVPSIGSFIMGAVAEHVGLRIPVAAGAVICLLLWATAWHERKSMAAALEVDPTPHHSINNS
jgi:predicted MFS family arabinose efflux permease